MADIDTSTGGLWWLQNPSWLNAQQQEPVGFKMLQQASEMRLRQQQQAMNTATQLIHNQMSMDEMDDAHSLNTVLPEWQKGNLDVMPQMKTLKGQVQAERLRSQIRLGTSLGQAQIAENNRIASTIDEIPESKEFIFKDGKVDTESLTQWSRIADQQKEARITRERTAGARVTAESREEIERIRQQQLQGMKTSGNAEPFRMEDGTIVPGMVKWWTGRTFQVRSVHDPAFQREASPSTQLSGLKALMDTSTDEEETKGYREQIKALLKKHPAAATPSSTPAATPTAPVRVNSKAERDALAPGTSYIGPDGQTYIKQ